MAAPQGPRGGAGWFDAPFSPRGFSTDPLVTATANEYAVGGTGSGFLQVYTFDSAAEAERNVIAADGSPTRVRVYRSGPLVVAYYGSDAALGASLTRLLGSSTF